MPNLKHPQPNPPSHPTARHPEASTSKDFHYYVKNGETPWATLTFTADSRISKNIPTFIESTPITGRVTLDLPKPDSITGVEVTILGRVFIPQINVQVKRGGVLFLKMTKTLWSKGGGRHPGKATACQQLMPSSVDHTVGARGFSFTLPKTATIPQFESHPFHLPGTLSTHGLRITVSYRADMTILRGKFRSNDRLVGIPLGYISIIRAPPFPFQRWESYQSGLPPMDPVDDLEGWEPLKPIIMKGTAFNARSAAVKCSFFVAKPLVYVRGSFVPLYLELESDDSQLLEVLNNPKAITFVLCRYLKDRNIPDNSEGDWTEKFTWQMDDIEKAAWWVTPGQPGEGRKKLALSGELHLGSDFPPSLAIGRIFLEYNLCVFPLEIAGFIPDDKKTEVLLEHPIKIVTAFADHVRPVSQAPPGTKLRNGPTGRVFQPLRL